MIRDFLAHPLLELRVQHFEQQEWLKTLGATDDLDATKKAMEQPLENLGRQFAEFQEKYQTALIASNAFDGANASLAESKAVIMAIAPKIRRKRDERIGHLEALKDLFEEALRCAKLPFGVGEEGNPLEPQRVYKVREISDEVFVAGLPAYEELLPLFSDHRLADGEGVMLLKNHAGTSPSWPAGAAARLTWFSTVPRAWSAGRTPARAA